MNPLILLFALPAIVQAQKLCSQFGYHSSNGYYINNNGWGADAGEGGQCTYVDSMGEIGVSWHTNWTWSGGDFNVKAYPYSGRELISKALVSDITSLSTKAEWEYSGDAIRANVAYDLFTAANPNHDGSSGDYELMIWHVIT